MSTNIDLAHARQFALGAHGDQKYGVRPYIDHLDHVVSVMRRFGVIDRHVLYAGYLHDTIEDTPVTKAAIVDAFGARAADLVDAVTDGEGPNRKARAERVYRLIPTVPSAILVKLADRIANVEAGHAGGNEKLLDMYRKAHASFRRNLYAITTTGPTERMWAYLELLIWREV